MTKDCQKNAVFGHTIHSHRSGPMTAMCFHLIFLTLSSLLRFCQGGAAHVAELLRAKPLHHPSTQTILCEQPLPPHAQKGPAPALMVFCCKLEIPTVFSEGPTSSFCTGSHRLCSWFYLYICIIMMGDREWHPFPSVGMSLISN